jgi:NTP pyrophosphatase (non-canonical NTP hydrolase)
MAVTLQSGKYKIYHIPGKKIGCTTNVEKRVQLEQGYKPGEYEILFETDDIKEASDAERTLQKDLGYKVDIKPYKELFKSNYMKTHSSSEATTTFKIPLNDIDANFLADLVIETTQGTFKLDAQDKIDWVLGNVHASQFGPSTCYIYNRAMAREGAFEIADQKKPQNNKVFDNIRKWGFQKGILQGGDTKTQLIKLYEETGELSEAVLKNDKEEIIDAVGDIIVVLTNFAELQGINIEDCIESAYNEISNRTGKMINGTFVKDE